MVDYALISKTESWSHLEPLQSKTVTMPYLFHYALLDVTQRRKNFEGPLLVKKNISEISFILWVVSSLM